MATIIPIIGKNAEALEQTEIPVIGKNAEKTEGKKIHKNKKEVHVSEQTVIPPPGGGGTNQPNPTTPQTPSFLTTGIDPIFDCIVNVKNAFQIRLFKSPSTEPKEYIYELLTGLVDGEATMLAYFKDHTLQRIKRQSMQVVNKGTWQCSGTDSYKVCWEGKCEPIEVGMGGASLLSNDQSCCTGTNAGASGTNTASNTNPTTPATAPTTVSCPSGYNLPCPTLDEVRNCKKSFKECMKCSEIKELQQIPALAFFIEDIQDRDNKIKKFDEFFGPIMKEAVAAIQQYRDLEVDGKIGCKTLKSLEDSPDLEDTSSDSTDQVDDVTDQVDDVTDNTPPPSTNQPIKKSFNVDRSFFNPNDEW